ncbi:MAG: hypothetical protein A3C35_06180 [Omnitrophica bacterium RIFCSPHIGHO2_02_FULL_46_11]|nr:MAG: hypothetical protein A3C35_06180 [Omnitrophica bacterium RIFCSPHIGHO2_02_FULL_46_11]OGW87122.1 MAG: hypothetical protein A3A81_06950 [Omnitrophica bacterium RIFCSPLOWO2_01_FULL_45_10b]
MTERMKQIFKYGVSQPAILVLLVVLFLSPGFVSAATANRFEEANQYYHDGKYAEAVRLYEEIAKADPSLSIYYNLGNAYFKFGKLGLAILNYKRALTLNPRDRDVRQNLAYANQLIEYKIEDKRSWYFRKLDQLLSFLTLIECWVVVLGGYFIFVIGFLISLLRNRRPLFGKSGAIGFILVLFCSFPLFLKYGALDGGRPAIVTEQQAEVRYGPSTNDRLAFRLVEGLEVSLQDEKRDWYRIQLADDRSGWLPKSQVTAV